MPVTDTEPDFPDEKKMFCSCGVELSATTAYPKDRWGQDAKVSCETCHKKIQSDMVHEHVRDDRKRKETLQQVNSGRRKLAKLTQCKHCGSKTHFTIRSKQCPHNKTNKTKAKASAPSEPVVAPVQNDGDDDEVEFPSVDNTESVDWDAPIPEDETFDPLSGESTSASTTSRPCSQRAVEQEFAPKLGDNVLVTEGKQVFLAQLFKVDGDKYHVYFVGAPDDDDVGIVSLDQLKPETTPSIKRSDFLKDGGAEFYFDGAPDLECGRWKVRRIVGNEFVCVRLSGGTCRSTNLENFDISYVMDEVRAEKEYVRERGPFGAGRR